MTQEEAKLHIQAEWRIWLGHEHAAGAGDFNDALQFFEQLQHSRLKLLSFRYEGDKWELVKGWLLAEPKA